MKTFDQILKEQTSKNTPNQGEHQLIYRIALAKSLQICREQIIDSFVEELVKIKSFSEEQLGEIYAEVDNFKANLI